MNLGTDKLGTSLALAVRFCFEGSERRAKTLEAIDRELGAGAFHDRYSGMREEDGRLNRAHLPGHGVGCKRRSRIAHELLAVGGCAEQTLSSCFMR